MASKEPDADASRQDEINAFAAMANGDFEGTASTTSAGGTTSNNTGTFDFSAAIRVDNSRSSAEMVDRDSNDENDFDANLRRTFAQAGQAIDNSGTFSRLDMGTFRSHQTSASAAQRRNQNLEAAALALADPSDDETSKIPSMSQSSGHSAQGSDRSGISSMGNSGRSGFPNSNKNTGDSNFLQFPCGAAISNPNALLHEDFGDTNVSSPSSAQRGGLSVGGQNVIHTNNDHNANTAADSNTMHPLFGQIPPNKTPMHAQEVLLQRPLFFGPHLPPRVVEEAKKIVDDALQDQWRNHQEGSSSEHQEFIPKIGQLSPGVRNLVSAIRCYGFGLDIMPRGESEDSSSTSSPYVSVFCPRWSEDRKRSSSPNRVPADNDSVGDTSHSENSGSNFDQSTELSNNNNTEDNDVNIMNATPSKKIESSVGSNQQEDKETSASESAADTSLSERDMFSAFARHGTDYGADGDASESSNGSRIVVASGSGDSPTQRPRQNSITTHELSEQAQFTQWVHEGTSPGNVKDNGNAKSSGTFNFNDSIRGINTLVSAAGADDSDDDTVVGSEMKTKVGINEHLNAALASLEDGQGPAEAIVSVSVVDEGNANITQVPLTEDGGRPLSNQELMNAHAPIFGVDDPALPSESDLGNHETREEQQKSKEQRRIQAFIEKFCPHNVFGPLACPNPSIGPDDNHSWNSLLTPLQRNPMLTPSSNQPSGSITASPTGRSLSSDDVGSLNSNGYGITAKKASQLATSPKGYDPRNRYGWWNLPNDNDENASGSGASKATNGISNDFDENSYHESSAPEAPIQLPPVEHTSNGFPIQTQLEPSPKKLHMQNRPLSELHPATSLAQTLPFISDRPPSYRYLQVNTQAVAFPALVEEVEPLFCSVAIYHVETIAHNLGDRGMAPIPDLERCGKVTETLNFDLIKNPVIEKQCYAALSPYSDDSMNNDMYSHLTSCGVFPLPSNLSVNNLYAVITVGKVISEGSDFEPYLRPTAKGQEDQVNIDNLRSRAEKASSNHGHFVMPFAFGVAPLLQVFGADVPRVPSSRAVQIPLFRFYAGNGERQIIDHIMVMLYPRADHRASGIGGPAPLTNGGTAMLVMRNFGYLGLHEVVNGKSSLAMDRLIDFTGEMQLRRRGEESASENKSRAKNKIVPWRIQYEAEPTINGGRFIASNSSNEFTKNAQELAPVPLLASPHTRASPKSRSRGHSSSEDIEPYFHTTFCNELLCYPRALRNCQKGNIVIKVEIREIEWKPELGVFLAHLPSCGPLVHNLRRGPFLVQGAYTSCSARRPDPRFLDEFKLKLPLLLGNNESRCASIFFTVYRLSFSSRKKWGMKALGRKRTPKKFDEITSDVVGESNTVTGKDCQLIQLGCGFLPLEKKHSLLENGGHDVKISYIARYPAQDFCEKEGINSETIVMADFSTGRGDSVAGDDSVNDDAESQGSDRYFADTLSATSASDKDTVLSENMDDSRSKQYRKQSGMLLQVRISVRSSIHSQNGTLNEFLSQEPDVSLPLGSRRPDILSFLRSGKEAIRRQLNTSSFLASAEDVQYEAKKLLISTIDLARPDMCSVSEITSHLMRICKQLWKVTVVGTGNHDLQWANPANTLPLRVNAFATLLQVLGSSALFLSKRGVTPLNGNGKFSMLSLGRVMGLLFDEKEMFGDSYDETLSDDFFSFLSGGSKVRKASGKKGTRGHIRSNLEFGRQSDGVGAIITENTLKSNETPTKLTDVTGLEGPSSAEKSPLKSPISALELREKFVNESDGPKIDTVHDFKNAMQTGNREKDYEEDIIHEGQYSGNEAAASWIVAFGGSSGNRRFMTAPAPSLSTIQEDANFDEEQKSSGSQSPKVDDGPLDSLDSEIVLSKNSGKKRPVTQFRIPKLSSKSSSAKDNQTIDATDKPMTVLEENHQSLDLSTGVTLL